MRIIIYTKTGCLWCRDALLMLNERNASYEERNVTENQAYYQELVEKSGQDKTPTVDIDGVILKDSDAQEIKAYLDKTEGASS